MDRTSVEKIVEAFESENEEMKEYLKNSIREEREEEYLRQVYCELLNVGIKDKLKKVPNIAFVYTSIEMDVIDTMLDTIYFFYGDFCDRVIDFMKKKIQESNNEVVDKPKRIY